MANYELHMGNSVFVSLAKAWKLGSDGSGSPEAIAARQLPSEVSMQGARGPALERAGPETNSVRNPHTPTSTHIPKQHLGQYMRVLATASLESLEPGVARRFAQTPFFFFWAAPLVVRSHPALQCST